MSYPKLWANFGPMRYKREHGSYYLYEGESDRPVLMTDQVAVAYACNGMDTVLMKHGAPADVCEWMERARRGYIEAGFPESANELAMVTFPPDFDVEKLNRCLASSGYLAIMLRELGI